MKTGWKPKETFSGSAPSPGRSVTPFHSTPQLSSDRYALASDDVFLPAVCGGFESAPATVVINNKAGQIEEVLPGIRSAEHLSCPVRRVDGIVAPGFIELQTNGSYGVDVTRDDWALDVMSRRLPEQGVTTFFPTVVSSSEERYAAVFDVMREWRQTSGANIPGLHLEGPFFAPERKGAHNPANLRPLERQRLERLLNAGEGVLKILTFAPEAGDGEAAIRQCLERGVVPSAGHTEAGREDMERALAAGLPLITHLTNAMDKRVSGSAVEAVLRDTSVKAGVIVDGIHVKQELLRHVYEGLGSGRMVLVTDAAPPAGMPEGEYALGTLPVVLKDGAVRLRDAEQTLAGSALKMDEAIRNAVGLLGLAPETAVRMATLNPAETMGLQDRGVIAKGCRADLVVLDSKTLSVQETLVGGQAAYRR